MKIVLDTNIIISGLISNNSSPAQLLRDFSDEKLTLITSTLQLEVESKVLQNRMLAQSKN